MDDKTFGLLLIAVGIAVVVWDLWPIYLYKVSRNWPIAEATVLSIRRTGFIFRLRYTLDYSYKVQSATLKSFQILPGDPWAKGLKSGEQISVRYRADKPNSSVVDHYCGVGNYILLAIWNSVLIVVGICLLFKKKISA